MKTRTLLLRTTGAAALLCASGMTYAADMPPIVYPKAPTQVAVAPFNWTGLYLGVNAGYGFGFGNFTSVTPSVDPAVPPQSIDPLVASRGWLGGAALGYKYQAGQWVFGLETDGDLSSITGSDVAGNPAALNWFGTSRGIVGFAPFDGTTLFYVTAGVAYGGLSNTFSNGTKVGWTTGGGIEHALFGSQRWSAKVEYLFVDLGSDGGVVNGLSLSQNDQYSIVRAGVNYRFGN